MNKSGWTWVIGSPKWHYFDKTTMSLCNKWWVPGLNELDLEDTNHSSIDNCKMCQKEREKLNGKSV